MEIESSLPCSQQPAIYPNPEPNQSTPYTSTLFFEDQFFKYYFHIYTLVFQAVLCLRLPHQNTVCISPVPQTFHMPSPSYFSWFDHPHNICLSLNHEAVPRAFSFSRPSSPTFEAKMPPSAPYSRSPSAYVLTLMWQIKFHADMKEKIKLNDRRET